MRSLKHIFNRDPDDDYSFSYKRESAELTLLAHMIYQAVLDAMTTLSEYNLGDKIDAINWIKSNDKAPWTFLWCLLNLYDYDEDTVLTIAKRIRSLVSGSKGHFLRLHRVN